MAMAPKALIVDDHPLFRDALETALSLASGATAFAVHAGSIKQAQERLEEETFHLIRNWVLIQHDFMSQMIRVMSGHWTVFPVRRSGNRKNYRRVR